MPEAGDKSKYELKVECVITVPFHAEEPCKVLYPRRTKDWKKYWEARKRDDSAVRDIMRYIRETLRDKLNFIPFANNQLCSQQTRIRVKRIDEESV